MGPALLERRWSGGHTTPREKMHSQSPPLPSGAPLPSFPSSPMFTPPLSTQAIEAPGRSLAFTGSPLNVLFSLFETGFPVSLAVLELLTSSSYLLGSALEARATMTRFYVALAVELKSARRASICLAHPLTPYASYVCNWEPRSLFQGRLSISKQVKVFWR